MRHVLAAFALLTGATPALADEGPARLIGAALNVADLEAQVKFYTLALGMKVATTIDMGATTETILKFDDDPAKPAILLMHDKDRTKAKPLVQGTAFSRLVVAVPDAAAIDARLTTLGYAHGPVRDASHGTKILFVTDPAGFALELVQLPARPTH